MTWFFLKERGVPTIRIDKYLKNARIIKRRTVAKDACEGGRVSINSKIAKPGDLVKVGDIVEIVFGSGSLKIEVLDVKDNVSKDMADSLYKTL